MYFDNAATSFPKPDIVVDGVLSVLKSEQGNPGRTVKQTDWDIIFEARKKIAALLNVPFPNSIIFTANATEALNTVIFGLLKKGDHVVTTATEHNSVIRPLLQLKVQRDVKVSWIPCDKQGRVSSEEVIKAITPDTKLVIVNHGSNVNGRIQDVESIGEYVRQVENTFFLVDASQTIGHICVDNTKIKADFIVFAGHKGLLGVAGIGGYYINPEIEIQPLKVGGTGVLSELLVQPQGRPLKYESGTPNVLGIASLFYGIDYLNQIGISSIGKDLQEKTEFMIKSLLQYECVDVYSDKNPLGIVCLNVKGVQPARVAHFLMQDLGMKTRTGLLCAPFMHEFIHKNPFGCVRLSISYETTYAEIERFLEYVKNINQQIESMKNIKIPQVSILPSIQKII